MILICLLFLSFVSYAKCDIPVHCLSRHVEGKWEISLGLLKSESGGASDWGQDYDYECGYRRPDDSVYHEELDPDHLKRRFEEKKKQIIQFNTDRTINIIENGDINPEYSGFWRIVYDEGLYMEIYKQNEEKEIYFSFFKFQRRNDTSYSYCNRLIMGVVNVYHLNGNEGGSSSGLPRIEDFPDQNAGGEKGPKLGDVFLVKKEHKRTNGLNPNRINLSKESFHYVDSKEGARKSSSHSIDYYNDNYIQFDFFTMKRFCWYGKKVGTPDEPTNKIPVEIISPLVLDPDTHNKNYANVKLEWGGSNGGGTQRVDHEEVGTDHIVTQSRDPSKHTNKSHKGGKQNSIFNTYREKEVTLAQFDWTNEADVRKRLNGNWVKVIDEAIDQKNCGSCYANSAALIINSRVRIKYNYIKNIDLLSFSNKQLVLCDFFNQGCNGGYIYLSLKYAYENFLFTNKCFVRYSNLYLNRDKKNSALCDRFDTFKIFLQKGRGGNFSNAQVGPPHRQTKRVRQHEPFRGSEEVVRSEEVDRGEEVVRSEEVGRGEEVVRSEEVGRGEDVGKSPTQGEQHKGGIFHKGENKHSGRHMHHMHHTRDVRDVRGGRELPRDDQLNEGYLPVDASARDASELDVLKLHECDAKVKVTKFEYLDIEDEEDLKKYLYHNGPVAAAIEPSKNFSAYREGILTGKFIKMSDGGESNAYVWNKVDHAVVIVGWGEDTVENLKKKIHHYSGHPGAYASGKGGAAAGKVVKYWKILNSWGTHWGYDGYFYILRDENYFSIKSYLLACDVSLFIRRGDSRVTPG
ncbi:protease [Plasmodium cynomolgi strain B]|uniref:Dipeptidyl peptidase 1 n=1 Tax=Plasmodium cynomolgi (strain B) TaxID=1120755 RepID=K6V6H9_PLACD|nr:protease [Plasmodium cynomolgi strain B]GAB64712.1 protease [Plasmodium cynomolgi strain B]